MSRILQNFVRDVYSKLETDLTLAWAIDVGQLADFADVVKGIAKKQLSLACAATLSGLRLPRNEYAGGLVETSYLSIILAIKGLENCAYVLMRQTIELTLKHIYFSTHPVEYGWAATRESYREPSFHSLVEYVKKTEEYQRFSECGDFDLFEGIEERFAVLSRYVHVQSEKFISYKRMSTKRKVNAVVLRRLSGSMDALWPALTTMLIIFFPGKFVRAQEIEKRLIRSALSNEMRASLVKYLRIWSIS